MKKGKVIYRRSLLEVKCWQALCFVLPALVLAGPVRAQVNEQDSLALVAFYNATEGWYWNTKWLKAPVLQWEGGTVTGDRVAALTLGFGLLKGSIPPELANLDSLEILDLSRTKLGGPSRRNWAPSITSKS